MNKFFLLLAMLTAFASCTKEETGKEKPDSPTNEFSIQKRGFLDKETPGYIGQLPYIVSTSQTSIAEFNAELDIADAFESSEYDWRYFDQLHSPSMPAEQQQYLAYLILSKKDLIGIVRENPQCSDCKDSLLKYVNVLVENKYFGYCLLYNALMEIDDPEYVRNQAEEIITNAATETFHMSFLNEPTADETGHLDKVTENYSYLRDIRRLSSD